jgi:hypothetical protein
MLFVFAMVPIAVAGQDIGTPQLLRGVWIPAEKESKNPQRNYRLSITPEGERVIIVQEFQFEKKPIKNTFTLFPDGRGERNLVVFAGADSPVEIISKTKWKNGKLVRTYTHCYSTYVATESVRICNENTEIYSVSADGSQLSFQGMMRNGERISGGKRKFQKGSE